MAHVLTVETSDKPQLITSRMGEQFSYPIPIQVNKPWEYLLEKQRDIAAVAFIDPAQFDGANQFSTGGIHARNRLSLFDAMIYVGIPVLFWKNSDLLLKRPIQ